MDAPAIIVVGLTFIATAAIVARQMARAMGIKRPGMPDYGREIYGEVVVLPAAAKGAGGGARIRSDRLAQNNDIARHVGTGI